MLPFIPLHFLCTYFLQLVHCIELLPRSLPQTSHGHLTAFCVTFCRSLILLLISALYKLFVCLLNFPTHSFFPYLCTSLPSSIFFRTGIQLIKTGPKPNQLFEFGLAVYGDVNALRAVSSHSLWAQWAVSCAHMLPDAILFGFKK